MKTWLVVTHLYIFISIYFVFGIHYTCTILPNILEHPSNGVGLFFQGWDWALRSRERNSTKKNEGVCHTFASV